MSPQHALTYIAVVARTHAAQGSGACRCTQRARTRAHALSADRRDASGDRSSEVREAEVRRLPYAHVPLRRHSCSQRICSCRRRGCLLGSTRSTCDVHLHAAPARTDDMLRFRSGTACRCNATVARCVLYRMWHGDAIAAMTGVCAVGQPHFLRQPDFLQWHPLLCFAADPCTRHGVGWLMGLTWAWLPNGSEYPEDQECQQSPSIGSCRTN